MKNKLNIQSMIPLLMCFFVMGMVDIVGVSTNYIKKDFNLDAFVASLLPMLVFLWFALFSIPSGMLMGRIGRKKTVLLAVVVHLFALLLIYSFNNLTAIFTAFILLGIGNTIIQVSLNPLISDFVTGKTLTGVLTLGQFVKAVSSFLAPIVASSAAIYWGSWKYVFLIYACIAVVAFLTLYPLKIKESEAKESLGAGAILALLKNRYILKLFFGILLIVGIDVCMNLHSPSILMEKLNIDLEAASLGTSVYFAARTLGTFLGAFLLMKLRSDIFSRYSIIAAFIGFALLLISNNQILLYGSIFLLGLAFANIFSIIYSAAIQYLPSKANEISSLMIMGVAGGAILPPIMGYVSNTVGVIWSFAVLIVASVYLLLLPIKSE